MGAELAGAGVLLAVAIALINVRMGEEWGTGIFLVLNAAACALVLGLGVRAAGGRTNLDATPPTRGGTGDIAPPGGAATALLVAGEILLVLAISRLADVLGAEGGSGSLTWTALLFAAITAYPAWALRSAISALFAALAVGIAFIAAVDWIFDPTDIETFRWLILVLILAYAAASTVLTLEQVRGFERHGVQMVNAAGIATVILGLTLFAAAVASSVALAFPEDEPPQIAGPFGWELVLLIASAGLIAYAILRRQPGPGYLGAVGLTLFVILGGTPDDEATLVGWPLAVLLIATLALAATLSKRGAIRRTDDTAPPASGGSGPESGRPRSK